MEKKHPIENTTAAFFYDRAGNLLSSTIVEVEWQRNGIAFTSNGFSEPKDAKQMLESFKEIKGVDQVVGWLTSSSGRCRCFVVPPHTGSSRRPSPIPRVHRGALLQAPPRGARLRAQAQRH